MHPKNSPGGHPINSPTNTPKPFPRTPQKELTPKGAPQNSPPGGATLKRPKTSPGYPKIIPGGTPKSAPEGAPKNAPKTSQGHPKNRPRGYPRTPHGHPETPPHGTPESPQDPRGDPKNLREPQPRGDPKNPKSAFGNLLLDPRQGLDHFGVGYPKTPPWNPKTPKNLLGNPKTPGASTQGGPQNPPKTPKVPLGISCLVPHHELDQVWGAPQNHPQDTPKPPWETPKLPWGTPKPLWEPQPRGDPKNPKSAFGNLLLDPHHELDLVWGAPQNHPQDTPKSPPGHPKITPRTSQNPHGNPKTPLGATTQGGPQKPQTCLWESPAGSTAGIGSFWGGGPQNPPQDTPKPPWGTPKLLWEPQPRGGPQKPQKFLWESPAGSTS
ncbi:uncharacterized protein LOC141726292 [Zonotrichia albicollis]|uniref:uncharacterized protein LOC141726292 n=1 Tax=Zonotrichia albicollis TaxID=44394 RepID=UPI003D8110ED